MKRVTYSLLDALAEIGGIIKILNSSMTFLAFILSYDRIEGFLASQLYKIKDSGSNENKKIILPKCNGIKVFLVQLVPNKLLCRCCNKKSRQEFALKRAREKLNDEMNMLDIVK